MTNPLKTLDSRFSCRVLIIEIEQVFAGINEILKNSQLLVLLAYGALVVRLAKKLQRDSP